MEIKSLPVLTTSDITLITQNTVTCGGSIISEGGSRITVFGVCWSLKPNPTTKDSLTRDTVKTGVFTSSLKNLLADTLYYVRAYATNNDGTAYGLQMTFRTLPGVLPVLTTTAITNITASKATSGGIITFNGGMRIIARGVCWSININPTIVCDKTSDGNGNGTFTSNLMNLQSGTMYYLRSYAISSVGTAYGSQVTFKTLSLPTVSTSLVSSITAIAAISGGTVTADGGAFVTTRGVCWSTVENPTISNYITINGDGVGTFTSGLSGLSDGVTYYERAYATNSVGTVYGNQVSFTTPLNVTDIDGNVYHAVTIGTQTWMIENLKTTRYNDGSSIPLVASSSSWAASSNPAYCWYNNDITNYKTAYGALYNWYAVNTGKLAPVGWHVATNVEWTTLENYVITHLGTSQSEGKALAATTNWNVSTSTGDIGYDLTKNNSSGFSAVPGGNRIDNGAFYAIGTNGIWWSSTETDASFALARNLSNYYSEVSRGSGSKQNGFSVRCIRDY